MNLNTVCIVSHDHSPPHVRARDARVCDGGVVPGIDEKDVHVSTSGEPQLHPVGQLGAREFGEGGAKSPNPPPLRDRSPRHFFTCGGFGLVISNYSGADVCADRPGLCA